MLYTIGFTVYFSSDNITSKLNLTKPIGIITMFKISGLILSLTLSTTLNAAILDLGDITRDTATGLDWLDLTLTQGKSFDDIQNEVGGWLDSGYSYADNTMIRQLFENAGLPNAPSSGSDLETYNLVNNLAQMLGITETGSSYYRLIGLSGTSVSSNYHSVTELQLSKISNRSNVYIGSTGYSDNIRRYNVGHFLVKTSPVPVPAAAWLFGSALIGLAGIKRKSK